MLIVNDSRRVAEGVVKGLSVIARQDAEEYTSQPAICVEPDNQSDLGVVSVKVRSSPGTMWFPLGPCFAKSSTGDELAHLDEAVGAGPAGYSETAIARDTVGTQGVARCISFTVRVKIYLFARPLGSIVGRRSRHARHLASLLSPDACSF